MISKTPHSRTFKMGQQLPAYMIFKTVHNWKFDKQETGYQRQLIIGQVISKTTLRQTFIKQIAACHILIKTVHNYIFAIHGK